MQKLLFLVLMFFTICNVIAVENIKSYTFDPSTMKFVMNNQISLTKSEEAKYNYAQKWRKCGKIVDKRGKSG